MNELSQNLKQLDIDANINKETFVNQVEKLVKDAGYSIVELNDQKPWGAYIRFDGTQADRFVAEFFPGLTSTEARLGVEDAELSPKILIVAPGQRLSWQYHNRRAERWAFLTEGAYNKSSSDDEGEVIHANPGDVVQFARSERHRLVGLNNTYVLVAEIWQHSDAATMSDEDDIVRLADDYKR
jgi:mannose-6-phosphate isomerase